MTTSFTTILRISIATLSLGLALGAAKAHAGGFEFPEPGDRRFDYLFEPGICWEAQIMQPGPIAGWQAIGIEHGLKFYNSSSFYTHVTVSFRGGKTYVHETETTSVRYMRVPCPQPLGNVDLHLPVSTNSHDDHGSR